jgi:hypothetical protein
MKALIFLLIIIQPLLSFGQCKDIYKQNVECPTEADSLVLYNNALKVYEFYENNKAYAKTKSTELITIDEKKNVFELLQDAKKMFFIIRKAMASSKPDPRFPDVSPKPGYKDIAYKDYYSYVDEYRFYQRELENQIVNSNAPVPLYDSRIAPILINEYQNLDSNDMYFGDLVNIPLYIPVVVKPFVLLTNQELILRNEILHILPKIDPPLAIKIKNIDSPERYSIKRDTVYKQEITVYDPGISIYAYNEYGAGAFVGVLINRRFRKIKPSDYNKYAVPQWARKILENEKDLEKMLKIRFGEYYLGIY